MQLVHRKRRGQAIRHARARATAIEREHEAWCGRRATRGHRVEAKAAVQAAHRDRTRLHEGEERVPQQRPVGEHPPARALGFGRQRRRERLRQGDVVERALAAEDLAVDFPHAPRLEVVAAELGGINRRAGHVTSGERRDWLRDAARASTCRARRPCRAAASVRPDCAPWVAGGACFLARFMMRGRSPARAGPPAAGGLPPRARLPAARHRDLAAPRAAVPPAGRRPFRTAASARESPVATTACSRRDRPSSRARAGQWRERQARSPHRTHRAIR